MQTLKRELNLCWYKVSGRKPWSRGYGEFREREIGRIIDQGTFSAESLPAGYGFRLDERVIEYPWVFSRLPSGSGRLLDAGSVLNHRFLLGRAALRDKQVFISTLAPETVSYPQLRVSYVYEDMRDSCFRNAYFDWIVCLSTLEHVGMDNTMLYASNPEHRESDRTAYLGALEELRRLLRPQGKLYLSVPFGRAANHGWFQVFDAAMVDAAISAFAPASVLERVFHYRPAGWETSSRVAAREATYFDVHRSARHDPDYAAASRAVICLELTR